MKGKINPHSFIVEIIFFAAAACLILWPLFKPGFFVTDDGDWMVIRLSAFYQSLREGQLPVRFLGRLNYSYGYPVANFLYPGFMYFGSVLHALGLPFVEVVKVIMGLGAVFAGIFTYGWLRHWFGKTASLIGSVSVLWSPYLLFDIYKRGSVGEVLAMSAGAACLYSIERAKYLLPLFLAVLLVSHNSVALLFLLFISGYVFVTRQVRSVITPLILGIGMATWFWGPALAERVYVQFDGLKISDPTRYLLVGSQLPLLGLPVVIAFIVLMSRRVRSVFAGYNIAVVLVTALLNLPLFAWIWKFSWSSALIQFPYRLLAVSVFAGAWLLAGFVQKNSQKLLLLTVFTVLFAVGPMIRLTDIKSVHHPEGYYSTNEATTTVADEYLPRWVKQKFSDRAPLKVEFFEGSGSIVINYASTQRISGVIYANAPAVMQVNTIYYPGWGITVDGRPAAIDYHNPAGLMRFSVSQGSHDFYLEFRETFSRFVMDLIAVVFAVIYLWYLWVNRRK